MTTTSTEATDIPTVLYICVSNAGKSQMAEALTRQIAGDSVRAHSAGTHPKSSVNQESAAAVAESGADMSNATPAPIDPELLRTADRVIVLGSDAQVPSAPGMTAEIERWAISEPTSDGIHGAARMRIIRDEITAKVVDLVMELTGQPAAHASRYQQVIADLTARFEGVFTDSEVRAATRQAHAALAPTSKIPTFLPILVERFATKVLASRAHTSGRSASPHPRILFVCVHNAGRSQIAAALAHHLSGGRVNAQSAGSRPVGKVNEVALEVLAERGVPIPDAYPKPLIDSVLQAADVVITMGCGDECPVVPGKRYEDWPVADPLGADLNGVREITDDIQIRVTKLLGELLNR